jgi:AAA+ superfamily predicted ATPase
MGSKVPGFPEVQRALHADGVYEVYLLESNPDSNLVLVMAISAGNVPKFFSWEYLPRWWKMVGEDRISIKQIIRNGGAEKEIQAVLQVRGEWLGDKGCWKDETEEGLYALLTGLMDMAQKAVEADLVPDLSRSLMWKSIQEGMTYLISVIATPFSNGDETAIVRNIAGTIYSITTDIDFAKILEKGSDLPPLSRWSKAAQPKFSGLIAKCFDAGKTKDGINSLALLRAEFMSLCSGEMGISSAIQSSLKSVKVGSPAVKALGLGKVAGMHDLKKLLEKEVIRSLRDPEPFKRYGLTIPNGILLYGPPGCGKTYIARQLAEELGYYFVEIIPSEVGSSFIHGTVLIIRDLFEKAAERAPSIVFIDEFDALAPSRAELGGHQQFKSEEVNEFLAHLNTCAEKKIFVIAATNEPQKIDAAILRTGRLDKLIYVGPPDLEARTEMLQLHLAGRPVEDNLDLTVISEALQGYSASDIKFLVDEAARDALEQGVPISTEIINEAKQRVPPSVTEEEEMRYQSIRSRGIKK